MKTHIKHTLFVGALGLCLAACSDFLDEKGYNTDYSYYETAEGVESLVASCYQNGRGMFSTSNTPSGIISRKLVLICIPLVAMVVQTLHFILPL